MGEEGNWTAGGEGGAGPISKVPNNKRRSLGSEWSMSKVGNPPPHNSEKYHGLVAINNNNNIILNEMMTIYVPCLVVNQKSMVEIYLKKFQFT